MMNLWPPFLGAGIRITDIDRANNSISVAMKLRFYNRNMNGTHYGGSLFSMCDPFFVFVAFRGLGDDYVYWDKSASIKFKRPGKGRVRATFSIPDERLAEMKKEVDRLGKSTFFFNVNIYDENNKVVAEVEKEIYIKKK